MITLRVEVPYASFRKSYARSFAETYPLPPPATVVTIPLADTLRMRPLPASAINRLPVGAPIATPVPLRRDRDWGRATGIARNYVLLRRRDGTP